MTRDLATIDALSLIQEKAAVTIQCITGAHMKPDDIQVLAYIASDYLMALGQAIQNMPAIPPSPTQKTSR